MVGKEGQVRSGYLKAANTLFIRKVIAKAKSLR